jgi:hypothetical protein
MRQNFTKRISFDGKTVLAVIIPEHRKDGMYYEINIKGYARFYMTLSPLGRYDVVPENPKLPYNMVLAVSDAIEEKGR